jgi:transcriptional regulator GlxA family with amidase domain
MRPRVIGFLLINDFALMAFASAIEPLRAANILAGRQLYEWKMFATDDVVVASNGLSLRADHLIGSDAALDTLFVCAGGNPVCFHHRRTTQWLRRLARSGIRIGGVSAGPFILARAGLLDGYRCTVHWEHVPAFLEAFPHLQLTRTLYEIDRNRLTCAGGVAAFDLMHALIAEDHGAALADEVADWFLQTQVRLGSGSQRRSLRERLDVSNPRLLSALTELEGEKGRSLPRQELAARGGVSVRQLERLFESKLGTTIEAYRRKMRLHHARTLLRQTTMPVLEVALVSGFTAASHFSRAYRATFGRSPREERKL